MAPTSDLARRRRTPAHAPVTRWLLLAALTACGDPTAPAVRLADLSAVGSFACLTTENDLAYCFSRHAFSPLGTGPAPHDTTRFHAVAGGHRFSKVFVGGNHACALSPDGVGYCWGNNLAGEIGNDTRFEQLIPSRIAGEHRFRLMALGDRHTCALDMEGAAWCWGENTVGQVGDSTPDFARQLPARVAGGLRFRDISAGFRVTCGITTAEEVYCWGDYNDFLPEATRKNYRSVPQRVPGTPPFTTLGAGTCGLTASGAVHCWSRVLNPDGSPVWQEPVLSSGTFTFKSLSRNGRSALTTEGQVIALGTMQGAIAVPPAPVPHTETLRFDHFDGSCGVTRDRALYCATGQPGVGYIYLEVPLPR